MTVLGLDVSTRTGAVVLEPGATLPVFAEEIVFKGLEGMERCAAIARRVAEIRDQYQPELVVVEGYGFANAHSLATLVEIGTVLRYFFWQEDVRHAEVAPSALKKFVLGKGVGKKDLMLLETFKRWGFETKSDNICDGYGLARIGLALQGHTQGLTKPMQEVISTIAVK